MFRMTPNVCTDMQSHTECVLDRLHVPLVLAHTHTPTHTDVIAVSFYKAVTHVPTPQL